MSRDIRTMFGAAAPTAASAAASPAGAMAKRSIALASFGPTTTEGHVLPPQLQALIDRQCAPTLRAAWPVPRRLGFGCLPTDFSSPSEWLREQRVRILVDVCSERGVELRELDSPGLIVLRMPLDSRHKMTSPEVSTWVKRIRVLFRVLAALLDAELPASIYFCDARGGGVAAFPVVLMIMQQYRVTLTDARIFVTRCMLEHAMSLVPPKMRVFPDGDALKQAAYDAAPRLRDRMLNEEVVPPEDAMKLFRVHGVPSLAKAAWALLGLDPELVISTLPFSRAMPLKIVVWATRDRPTPPAEDRPRGRRRPFATDEDDDDEDGDDDDDERVSRFGKWRKRFRPRDEFE